MTRAVDDPMAVAGADETPLPPAKGMTRRLVGGTLNYGIGQALPQVVRFALVPVFAQVLTETDYGILELAGTFMTVLVVLMRLGVPGAVSRFYYDHREGPELTDYVTTIAIFMLCTSVVVGGITLLVAPWLLEQVVPALKFYPFGLLALATAFVSCNQNLQDRLVQAREQSAYSAMLNITRAAIAISLLLVFVLALRWQAYGYLLAELIAATAIFFQAGRYLLPNLRGRFRPEMLGASLKYAMGILPMHLMGIMGPFISQAILADVVNVGAVGELGVARRFLMPLTVLATAFQTAFLPIYFSLRKDHSEKNAETLARTARFVWAGTILVAISATFLVPPLLVLMTPDRLHNAAPLVPILVVAFVAQMVYMIFAPEIYYSKATFLVPVISATQLIVNIGVTWLTVERFGAYGSAWATSLAMVATAILAITFSRRLADLPHRPLDVLRLAACGAAVAVVAWPLAQGDMVQKVVVACAVTLAFPALLWITGDPTVREAAKWGKDRLAILRGR